MLQHFDFSPHCCRHFTREQDMLDRFYSLLTGGQMMLSKSIPMLTTLFLTGIRPCIASQHKILILAGMRLFQLVSESPFPNITCSIFSLALLMEKSSSLQNHYVHLSLEELRVNFLKFLSSSKKSSYSPASYVFAPIPIKNSISNSNRHHRVPFLI